MTTNYIIRSVERTFQIMDLVCEKNRSISISDVSKELKLNSNTAYRLLTTMVKAGILIKDPIANRYSFSLRILEFSYIALNQLEIRNRAMPYLEALWQKYRQANVNMAVLERQKVMAVVRIESEKMSHIRFSIGRPRPAHASSLGKMLISELDDEELQYVMGLEKLKKYTDRTLSTLDDLKKELKKIRSEQLSWDLGEQIPHNNCMAAPIRDSSRKIVAAVSLSALDFHMSVDELEKASVDLKEAANVISSAMGLGMT